MNHNEFYELTHQYVQGVLDECRLLHRPEHIADTLADLRVRHEPSSRASSEGYSVLDKERRACGRRVTVADLGAAKYSMESMKQCVSDNRQAMLDIHSDLMDVRRGGESEGGAQSLPSYKSAAPGSVRMSGSPTFDELMEAQRSRDVAKDVDASIAEIVAKRGLVNLSLRRERELDQARNVDESRPLDEPAGTRRQSADEDAEIEEAEQEQGADEDAEIEEAEQEQGADEDAEIEEATVKPKPKNPKSDMEERRHRFPELRPYLGNVTGGEDEFDMEERLRKFPELGPYQG